MNSQFKRFGLKLWDCKSFTESIQRAYQKGDNYSNVYSSKGIQYYTKDKDLLCLLSDLKTIKMEEIRRFKQLANIANHAIPISA